MSLECGGQLHRTFTGHHMRLLPQPLIHGAGTTMRYKVRLMRRWGSEGLESCLEARSQQRMSSPGGQLCGMGATVLAGGELALTLTHHHPPPACACGL